MDILLNTEGLTKSYFGKKALNVVTIEIPKGKIVGILGPNGSGKTTLLNLIK